MIPETDKTFKNIHRRSFHNGSNPVGSLKLLNMKVNIFTWKGDYIYLLPTIAICIDEDYYPQYMKKYLLIKLLFLKGTLGIQILWKKQKTLD